MAPSCSVPCPSWIPRSTAFRSIIKNVELTNFSATQPKDFNIQKLIRDQGYQDVSGPIRFVGRIDANCPTLIDGQIPGITRV